ncbi:MAG: alpha-mannosidase, partial [Cyanobacteria bacterium J06632_22]
LTWWAEDAQLFVDGVRVRCGDLFDYFTRFCLAEQVLPGTAYTLAVRLVSPGHDDGALVRSQLLYEVPDASPESSSGNWPSPEPGFVADELAVLGHYLQQLAPAQSPALEQATAAIDWAALSSSAPDERNRQDFHRSLAEMRQQLAELGQWVRQRRIDCVGHAHLDMAWLWPVADTWQAAERTFESVLGLQKDFPELTYTHSSPALFAWLEVNRPDLFTRIQYQVQAGTWSIDAGLWIEPELNIISGESIARQLLYGQRYCQSRFGHISTIAWLPDTFGFCSQLPQLLRLGGVEVFATQKLRWNDTTQFPYELFEWRGPDGSTILSWTLPPIGTDFDPVQIAAYAAQWEARTGIPQVLWLPGVGDHGGGPTREMLETARRWAVSPLFPGVSFTRPEDFIDTVKSHLATREGSLEIADLEIPGNGPAQSKPRCVQPTTTTSLPVWRDELYLELHRGCYTTHADQKWFNRRCEDALYEAELWATIAHLLTQHPYPKAQLEKAWKLMLFNQFHDILPGSAIPEVFEDANRDWQQAQNLVREQLEQALQQLESYLVLPPPPQPEASPILVFNALSWDRAAIVVLDVPGTSAADWTVCNRDGQSVPSQRLADEPQQMCFRATVPAVGYAVYWLCPQDGKLPVARLGWSTPTDSTDGSPKNHSLENAYLRVSICARTGEILSLFDCIHQREVLGAPANQLQAFADDGQYWDAWNIAPDYENQALPAAELEQIHWLERGPVRQRLRVQRRLRQSTITQVYCLEVDSPLLKIETEVDWQETQVLLKVNFPTAFQAAVATYEAPFGVTVRSTQAPPPGSPPATTAPEADFADADSTKVEPDGESYESQHAKTKWEVPALRWADLTKTRQDTELGTDQNPAPFYGLSILTDGKHGFDARPDQLRLTLLKSPLWPDPGADRGEHRFTYALYPHAGGWQQAETVQWARSLNQPLTVRWGEASDPDTMPAAAEPDCRSFIRLRHGVLAAFKPVEASSQEDRPVVILRCYDAAGTGAMPEIDTTLNLKVGDSLDLLERPLQDESRPRPYQIWTYRLDVEPS